MKVYSPYKPYAFRIMIKAILYIIFAIPRKRPNERSECDLEQLTGYFFI